jgi:hypothetical protein
MTKSRWIRSGCGPVICIHGQAPTNTPLRLCVLMMILWRQRMSLGRGSLASASHATINAGARRSRARLIILIKDRIVVWREVGSVLVKSHNGQFLQRERNRLDRRDSESLQGDVTVAVRSRLQTNADHCEAGARNAPAIRNVRSAPGLAVRAESVQYRILGCTKDSSARYGGVKLICIKRVDQSDSASCRAASTGNVHSAPAPLPRFTTTPRGSIRSSVHKMRRAMSCRVPQSPRSSPFSASLRA